MQAQYTVPPPGDMGVTQARARLIVEYGNHCLRCGFVPAEDETPLAVDHIIPIARGGRNRYGNYQLLCTPCNNWKGTKTLDFRPGPPRGRVRDDLPIIPEEERHRKRPLKLIPGQPQEPSEIVVPIMVPLPPAPHDCYGALPKLFAEYKASANEVARLSAINGRLESQVGSAKTAAEIDRQKAHNSFMDAHKERMKSFDHRCPGGVPFGCFGFVVVLFLMMLGTSLYLFLWR